MSAEKSNHDTDDHVDTEIYNCLKLENPKSFFLFAGAGSGKTRSLVKVLTDFKTEYGKQLRLNRKKVAIITYTNAACDEIIHRLKYDPIFAVTTIHSYAWELIKNFNHDIKLWLKNNLANEIYKLEEEQSKSKNLLNKTSIDRTRKIESKNKRLDNLNNIQQFTYNPNGDNISKDSLNHSEVISIAANFIQNKPLMQDLLVCKFPIVLVDESQDTKKDLINAFFELQKNKKESFSLGLFGDTMQRIYVDGKENLELELPKDWIKPVKKMNHRSNKRIISLINSIRQSVDKQKQEPRNEKEEGFVRLFICKRGLDKQKTEVNVSQRMSEITGDFLWNNDINNANIKTLILEHHMAARRMGFLEFFEPLYKEDRLSTGVLDGTLAGANFFTKIILPIVNANEVGDKFAIARIVKKYSAYLNKNEILKNAQQIENIRKANMALLDLLVLWDDNADPLLIDVIKNVYKTELFPLPDSLLTIAKRTKSDLFEANKLENIEVEDEVSDDVIDAWDLALANSFSQIKHYNDYISEDSKFGTHQGVKGLEYERVMVILDDEESKGFLFSYDKLFGSKDLSPTDRKNIEEGKETANDRTRRLFYVACSRAKESLAIVAYTDNPEIVSKSAIEFGWFKKEEIVII
ncbi:Fis family transcriptional regulator [Flavobacterium sp. KMS]|uniref:UvrD-helicase domain-containing protein n=1 Tax=Flavobacterium sp. KMS TaxID=1566023 RepID=UPI00057D69FA|nr:UvrD-helicase domain-containing protein [Flavobacterium sp. KMS]KIA94492.1 Fis family transcriptional regulator [Flavobacterium sp. KMS]